ncbi:aminotransferase class V-fold PLP-dependent enzyme [Rubinisphaera sp. JC750]|uniref:aminotransferase class V-fold PLP-dependent enzyme n=1 Tax=Rubinisphaera sp. JC750 TaxID=2898658 RepID=UPI001F439F4D|nr:aminotransferase class V-fold PLP-dependent enzyme [Rubinisphaera sp. JC750]
MSEPIYLDHAATSAPKPAAVAARVQRYLAEEGFSAGRGSYRRAEGIGREIAAARGAIASLINAAAPNRIVFTGGGTESLNLVLQGLLKPGDHVIATDLEHNSVLRPLAWLTEQREVDVTFVSPEASGAVSPASIQAAITSKTRLICCVHASNVTGIIQPVAEIGRIAREQGVLTLIDAAQTLGHLPFDIAELGCDFLAAPGHKGLLGPLGTGLLYVAPGREDELQPLILGGTGTQSEQAHQPLELPFKLESGSRNVPGLLGLCAAMETVTPEFVAAEMVRQRGLTDQLIASFAGIDGVDVVLPETPRVGVVSITIADQDPRIVETILDGSFGIETRSGFHCAPRTHAWLGTVEAGGTLRFSVGHSTTPDQIAQAVEAIRQLTAI